MSDSIVLSSRDTDRFQEFAVDKEAAKVAFAAALAFYQNHVAEILTCEKLMWDHVMEAYNLDYDKNYKAKWSQLDRRMVIVERDDGDDA